MKKLYFIFQFAILFSSCTGNWVPIDVDKTLGEQSGRQIENSPDQFKLLEKEDCPYAFERIESIRDQILETGEIKYANDFNWKVHLVKDDSVLNAFCLPGGNIYIYTGLIKYLDSEAALAGVIGHEMAHADLRHSTKQLVQNLGLSLVIQYLLGVDQSSLINIGANLSSLSFSRSDESDADMQSVEYLNKTGYDPRGAAFFFEKIEKEHQEHPSLEFINTHPNPDNRIKKIYEKWKDLGGKKGELQKESYKKIKGDLP